MNTLTVVGISHPVIEGDDLMDHYKLVKGTIPKSSGSTAWFIDWTGVGVDCHGVEAGAHGVRIG
jgi:hypothetical protein